MPRIGLPAPAATISQSAWTRYSPSGVALVEHQYVDGALRKIDRSDQPDRACAGDDHRPVSGRAVQVGGLDVGVDGVGISFQLKSSLPSPLSALLRGEGCALIWQMRRVREFSLPALPTSPCPAAPSRRVDRGAWSLR